MKPTPERLKEIKWAVKEFGSGSDGVDGTVHDELLAEIEALENRVDKLLKLLEQIAKRLDEEDYPKTIKQINRALKERYEDDGEDQE